LAELRLTGQAKLRAVGPCLIALARACRGTIIEARLLGRAKRPGAKKSGEV
jgi:hypothetical protein